MSERTPSGPVRGPARLEALLEPTLADTAQREPPYSLRAGFIVAFFGGLFATVMFSWLNSRRLHRLREDGWLYAAAAVVWTAILLWLGYAEASRTMPSWLSITSDAHRDVRYVGRALSLAVFGLFYLRLRRFYVAANLAGDEPPNPWMPGLACAAAGAVLSYVIAALGASLTKLVPASDPLSIAVLALAGAGLR